MKKNKLMKVVRRPMVAIAVGATLLVPTTAWAVTSTATFTDVPSDHTHVGAIEWMDESGITKGCTESTFCPSGAMTRGAAASFFHRLSGHADGVAPSVDAATVGGLTAAELKGDAGAQGETGAAGAAGAAGAQGEQGAQGAPGQTGAQGDKGDDGASGTVVTGLASLNGLACQVEGEPGTILIETADGAVDISCVADVG